MATKKAAPKKTPKPKAPKKSRGSGSGIPGDSGESTGAGSAAPLPVVAELESELVRLREKIATLEEQLAWWKGKAERRERPR